jgi:hypothetical protein
VSGETQSQDIKNLVSALVKVQGKIKGAKMDSENPYFKSHYADLTSVWEACRELLSANGLAVVQTMAGETAESVTVVTTLAHTSGEWIRGSLTMKPVKADPQGVGSAVTYARRYALAAIVGVCPEDDDGAAASGTNKPPRESIQNKNAQHDKGTFSDYIKECSKTRTGVHNNKPWTLWTIATQENGPFATFEERVYTACCIAMGDGVKITLDTEPGKNGPVITKAVIMDETSSA